MAVGSEQAFSQALERLTEPKAASALSSPLVSSVLYTSMEGVASATAGSGRGVDTEVLSDSLLDEILKVVDQPLYLINDAIWCMITFNIVIYL